MNNGRGQFSKQDRVYETGRGPICNVDVLGSLCYFSDMELTNETKYKLLNNISQLIRDTLDLDDILNHFLDMVQPFLDYDAAGIFILNQDLIHPHNVNPRDQIAGIVMRGYDIPPSTIDPMLVEGKGIIGYVIKTGKYVVAPDVGKDPHYVIGHIGTLSEVVVPIVRKERVIGALNLESNKLDAYSDGDVEVLQFFADAASISIDKAMLHRQILEKKLIEKQMELAQFVQSCLLPNSPPDVPGYDIAGTCIPTYKIGGDYFDYFELPNGELGIVVADVSGKGIPAAMIMTAFRALLRTLVLSDSEPIHVIDTLKNMIPDFIGEMNFVSSVYGILNPSNGNFKYVNCGHWPPIIFHTDGTAEKSMDICPVLSGAFIDMPYHTLKTDLKEGDLLLLHTDGVTEILNSEGEELGIGRLEAVVKRSLGLTSSEIISNIIQATQEFSGSDNFTGDYTLVVVQRNRCSKNRP